MNKEIKQEIEEYVLGEFKFIEDLDPNEDGYNGTKSSSIKDINILVELLQKDEVNESNSKINFEKLKNEAVKIERDHEINLKKLDCEIEKNKETLGLENRKIDSNEYKNNSDTDLRRQELNMNSKKDIELRNDRIIKLMVDGITIIAPIIFYNVWMERGFIFEETGTFTSNTFKNMFSKFKPTK